MKDATIEECNKCEHKAQIRNKMGVMFEVCNCACGRATKNSGHPLCPCNLLECWDQEEEPECETDEEAIMEGHRCLTYCAWLAMMDHHNGPGFKYPERWNKRK